MGAVSVQSAKDAAQKQAQQANQSNPTPQGNGFMNYLNQVSKATDYMLTHPISDVTEGLSALAGLVTGNGAAAGNAARRMMGWVQSNPVASLKLWVIKQIAALAQQIVRLQAFTVKLVHVTADSLWKYINDKVRVERHYRIRGDQHSEWYARVRVRGLHQLIEREAAGAYRQGFRGRLSVISTLADYVAAHNPIVKRLVGMLVSGILDLASVDDPPARLLLGFLMRHVIDKLGIDRLAGHALDDMLAPLLGEPKPHDLPTVIADISQRLVAGESQWAQFYANGGTEVEQAGHEWAAITSPVIDAAIIAWLGQAVLEPQKWADELSDVIEPVMTGAQDIMSKLLREA